MNDAHVGELLDGLTPRYDDHRGDWERVAADARPRRVPRVVLALVLAGAVAAGLALAWPFHSDRGSLVDRALAAAGDGPVLHVVLRGDWGGTLVNQETGARTPVYGEQEYWYDTESGRVHSVSRLGGAVQSDGLDRPTEVPVELKALGRDYRRALESGTARVAEHGTVDGEPVVWLEITHLNLPDVADGKNHLFEQQVAVSERTYKPLAFRARRDRKQLPDTFERVLDLEFSPSGSGDFTAAPGGSLDGREGSIGSKPMPFDEAAKVLGRTPMWLGREYQGLPLATTSLQTTKIGHREQVQLTSSKAAAAQRCLTRGRARRTCLQALGITSFEVRAGRVFTEKGPIVWTEEEKDVVLFYGTMGDDPTTYRKDSVPQVDKPHVIVTETAHATALRRLAGSYQPPPGSVFLIAPDSGFLQADGLQVQIEAPTEQAILAAARTLKPLSP